MPRQNSLKDLEATIIAKTCENERRVASQVHVLVAKRGLEVLKHTLIVKRDNLLGHLKLFPEYRRSLEVLNEAASGLAWMLRDLTGKCGQEAHARQRGYADDSQCARHNHESTRTFQCEFYDAFTPAQSCFLLFKCQGKALIVPVDLQFPVTRLSRPDRK